MGKVIFIIAVCTLGSTIVRAQQHLRILEQTESLKLEEIEEKFSQWVQENDVEVTRKSKKQFARWKMSMEPRLNEEGEVFNFAAKNEQELRTYIRNFGAAEDNRAAHGDWEDITPPDFDLAAPANGRVNCIAIHPANSNIIYVGTPIGGLWVSYSGGNSWSHLTDGLPSLSISDIAIDYDNHSNIYLLTGDGDGRHIPGIGILKSTNGGIDWSQTNYTLDESNFEYGYKLIMDPDNPLEMYAATTRGLFRTTNGWVTSSEVIDESMRDVEFVPGHPDTMYACSWNTVYKSTDNGLTWSNLSTMGIGLGLPTLNSIRVAITINNDFPQNVYVLHTTPDPNHVDDFYRLYHSDDWGQDFDLKSSGYIVCGYQSGYDLEFTTQPNSPGTVFLGSVAFWKSTDFGQNFVAIANATGMPEIHSDIHSMVWEGNTLYIGTDGGIVKTTNYGQTYTDLTAGLKIMQFYDIDVQGTQVMGGTQDNGTNEWTVGDIEGDRVLGGDGFECMYTGENYLYYCTQVHRYRYDFGGSETIITPINQTDAWDASWIMHPTNPETTYCAKFDIAISYDGGENWTYTNPQFPQQRAIRAMAQGISNTNRMYASDRVNLRRTTSIHAPAPTWIDITGNWNISPNNGPGIGGIAVDPANENRVWVSFNGYRDTLKVMFSSVGGFGTNAWQNITGNLPNVPVLCAIYEPGSNDGIYVGTDIGVFYRNASLGEWIWYSNGLPKTRVEDLKIENGYLYAGTHGRGIWRSDLFGNCPPELYLTQANDPDNGGNTGTRIHAASDGIVSERVINGSLGTNVRYSAGNYVRLDVGFHAKVNNEFQADLDGCPD